MTAKRPTLGSFFFLAVLVGGCSSENEELPFRPDDCVTAKPLSGYLIVDVTINDEHPLVPVELFLGPLEDGRLLLSDSLDVVRSSFLLPVDQSYTVVARYVVGPDTILVLADDSITTIQTEYRDGYCWEVNDGRVDAQLRF